jgi:hypothetical protein
LLLDLLLGEDGRLLVLLLLALEGHHHARGSPEVRRILSAHSQSSTQVLWGLKRDTIEFLRRYIINYLYNKLVFNKI